MSNLLASRIAAAAYVAHGQGNAGGRVTEETKTVPPSQMDRVLERQEMCIASLETGLHVLEKRLDGLLDPAPPMDEAAAVPVPMRCSLGVALDAHSDRIYAVERQLAHLLERLAV